MKNKNICFLFLFLLLSCSSSRNNQVPSGENLWFSWEIIFKPGTTESQRRKTLDEMEKSLTLQWKDDGPGPTINYHTLIHNERFVLLYGTSTQGTQPKTPPGSPHNPPDFRSYKQLKTVENIVPMTMQQFNELKTTR